MFYWILLNLDPHLRFTFNNIQLLACAPAVTLKEQGLDLLLDDFVTSINKLNESGIELNGENYHGFLAFCMGDTLALQWLGGFVEGVGKAKRFCRNCEITYDDRKNLDPTIKYDARTMEKHISQLNLISKSEDEAFYTKTFGVKNKSELLKIKDFDLCTGLLQDTMHTLIEGVCIKEIKCLFKYLIESNCATLEKLNGLILCFEYSPFDKSDLPKKFQKQHIFNNDTLNLTAGQMLTLMINLPLIIGDTVNNNDVNWKNFLVLHNIINIAYSYTYENRTVNELENMITVYLTNFQDLYVGVSITPKMHYLTHLPQQLKNFGPLRHSSCFRCEAKNGLIKGMDFKSFKNLSFSISNHHQFWISGQQTNSELNKSIAYNEDKYRVDCVIDASHKFWIDLKPKKYISKIKYLKKDGFQYKDGFFLVLKEYRFAQSIGLIVDILNVDDEIIFNLKECKILNKNKHKNCLIINPIDKFFYVKHIDLQFRNAQYAIKHDDFYHLQVRFVHFLI